MPKLRGEVLDKIKSMIRLGRIDAEISETLHVDRKTVHKIRQSLKDTKSVQETDPKTPKVLYDLMVLLNVPNEEGALRRAFTTIVSVKHILNELKLGSVEEIIPYQNRVANDLTTQIATHANKITELNTKINDLYYDPRPIFAGCKELNILFNTAKAKGYNDNFISYVNELAIVYLNKLYPNGYSTVTQY